MEVNMSHDPSLTSPRWPPREESSVSARPSSELFNEIEQVMAGLQEEFAVRAGHVLNLLRLDDIRLLQKVLEERTPEGKNPLAEAPGNRDRPGLDFINPFGFSRLTAGHLLLRDFLLRFPEGVDAAVKVRLEPLFDRFPDLKEPAITALTGRAPCEEFEGELEDRRRLLNITERVFGAQYIGDEYGRIAEIARLICGVHHVFGAACAAARRTSALMDSLANPCVTVCSGFELFEIRGRDLNEFRRRVLKCPL